MFHHHEKKILPYDANFMYHLVGNIKAYDQFLPWCMGVRITKDTTTHIIADLIIGYKGLREKFTSDVTLKPEEYKINFVYLEGPFKNMKGYWHFKPVSTQECEIDFEVIFDFNNRLLSTVLKGFFDYFVRKMVTAFEERAAQTYHQADRFV